MDEREQLFPAHARVEAVRQARANEVDRWVAAATEMSEPE
jgi:hypothetical protein